MSCTVSQSVSNKKKEKLKREQAEAESQNHNDEIVKALMGPRKKERPRRKRTNQVRGELFDTKNLLNPDRERKK